MKSKKAIYFRILIYFIIAVLLSALFRFQLFDWYKNFKIPFGLTAVKFLLEGTGPLIGAIFILKVFRKKSSITLFGTSIKRSIMMISLPIVLFSVFGVQNDLGLNRHYYGFITGTVIIIYCLLEETGWRGYLQEELKGLNPFARYFIIGTLWYIWHLSFLSEETSLFIELKILAILIFASWGIGQIAGKTKSLIAASCFHFLGSMLGFSPLLSTAFNSTSRYIIIGILLCLWIFILGNWDKEKRYAISGSNH